MVLILGDDLFSKRIIEGLEFKRNELAMTRL